MQLVTATRNAGLRATYPAVGGVDEPFDGRQPTLAARDSVMAKRYHGMSPDVMAKALSIHENCLVLDAHADIVIDPSSSLMLGADGSSLVSPDKLVAGGVGAVVMCIAVDWAPRRPGTDASGRAMADTKLEGVRALIDEHSDTLALATSVAEIADVRAARKVAVVLGFQNARGLGGDLDALDAFFEAGCRVFALVHMGHNDYCDSSRPIFERKTASFEPIEVHGGLSLLGREAIGRINELGGVVDVSQMSIAATVQTIGLSSSPVVASHSNVRAVADVARNLSDEEIDLIGETGGVIHISGFGPSLVDASSPKARAGIDATRAKYGLAPTYSYPYELYWELPDKESKLAFQMEILDVIGAGSVADMVRHIDYVVDRVGIDHVGIGNDFNHGGGRIGGLADASKSLNLTAALVQRGYEAEAIAKIWRDNFFPEESQLLSAMPWIAGLLRVASATAEARREGGFLGVGAPTPFGGGPDVRCTRPLSTAGTSSTRWDVLLPSTRRSPPTVLMSISTPLCEPAASRRSLRR